MPVSLDYLTMGINRPDKAWRLEVNNPQESTGWQLLWKFDTAQRDSYRALTEELNPINAPVQIRIVPDE